MTLRSILSIPMYIHRENLGEPSSKAKYTVRTDSEQVPRGKGEKKSETLCEIVPETDCEQTERAFRKVSDLVPIEE
jgi:hypothetical protein